VVYYNKEEYSKKTKNVDPLTVSNIMLPSSYVAEAHHFMHFYTINSAVQTEHTLITFAVECSSVNFMCKVKF